MVRKRQPRENEVQSIGIIREKRDAVYAVTLMFEPGYGPVVIMDEEGNPQLEGGEYEIKRPRGVATKRRAKAPTLSLPNP
jgi:hypothetical protein